MCKDFCDSIVGSSGFDDALGVPSLSGPGVNDLLTDDVADGRAGAGETSSLGPIGRGESRSLSNIEDEARWLERTPTSMRLDARRNRSDLSRSTLGRSQLRLDSVLRPPTPSPLPLPLPLPVPALVDERPSAADLLERSSLAPRRWCRLPPAPVPVADDSRRTLPIPSKNPVIVRTSSSLTLNISLKSPPMSFHSPTMSTSLPGLASETSDSISRSRARFVEPRSIPLTCSEKRTTACALRKTSGTVVVVVSPIGGKRERRASNIVSDSSISRKCSIPCSSSARAGLSRGRVRGEP